MIYILLIKNVILIKAINIIQQIKTCIKLGDFYAKKKKTNIVDFNNINFIC